MNILYLCIIGFSLSLDTFSFSLGLGTFNIKRKDIIVFPTVVGMFHFIMPLLGTKFGSIINKFLIINPNFLLGIIFLILMVQMITSKEEREYNISFMGMLLYAFSVSIDSFTVGIGLSTATSKVFLASFIFCSISFIMTMLGLCLGKLSYKKLGKIARIAGIVILTLLSIIHFLKV